MPPIATTGILVNLFALINISVVVLNLIFFVVVEKKAPKAI